MKGATVLLALLSAWAPAEAASTGQPSAAPISNGTREAEFWNYNGQGMCGPSVDKYGSDHISWTRNSQDTLADCQSACFANGECQSFVRDSQDGECILYRSAHMEATGPSSSTWECWHHGPLALPPSASPTPTPSSCELNYTIAVFRDNACLTQANESELAAFGNSFLALHDPADVCIKSSLYGVSTLAIEAGYSVSCEEILPSYENVTCLQGPASGIYLSIASLSASWTAEGTQCSSTAPVRNDSTCTTDEAGPIDGSSPWYRCPESAWLTFESVMPDCKDEWCDVTDADNAACMEACHAHTSCRFAYVQRDNNWGCKGHSDPVVWVNQSDSNSCGQGGAAHYFHCPAAPAPSDSTANSSSSPTGSPAADRCDSYCQWPCAQFGSPTRNVIECPGCDDSNKCHPGAASYNDTAAWCDFYACDSVNSRCDDVWCKASSPPVEESACELSYTVNVFTDNACSTQANDSELAAFGNSFLDLMDSPDVCLKSPLYGVSTLTIEGEFSAPCEAILPGLENVTCILGPEGPASGIYISIVSLSDSWMPRGAVGMRTQCLSNAAAAPVAAPIAAAPPVAAPVGETPESSSVTIIQQEINFELSAEVTSDPVKLKTAALAAKSKAIESAPEGSKVVAQKRTVISGSIDVAEENMPAVLDAINDVMCVSHGVECSAAWAGTAVFGDNRLRRSLSGAGRRRLAEASYEVIYTEEVEEDGDDEEDVGDTAADEPPPQISMALLNAALEEAGSAVTVTEEPVQEEAKVSIVVSIITEVNEGESEPEPLSQEALDAVKTHVAIAADIDEADLVLTATVTKKEEAAPSPSIAASVPAPVAASSPAPVATSSPVPVAAPVAAAPLAEMEEIVSLGSTAGVGMSCLQVAFSVFCLRLL